MNVATEPVTLRSLGESLAGVLYLPARPRPAPALIVCHGTAEFKEHYRDLCQFVAAAGVACLALDMHGHGASGGERFHVQMTEWVADVRAAVDFLGTRPEIAPEQIGAFGLSSGGTAILEAALVDPRLRALVAVDPTVRSLLPLPAAVLLRCVILLARCKRWLTGSDLRVPILKLTGGMRMASDPEVNRRLFADERILEAARSFPLPGATDCLFMDTLRRVGSITAPTLVIWGAEDEVDPPESGRLLYEGLTCKRDLQVIAGNGHVGHLDRNRAQVYDLTARWALENLTHRTTTLPQRAAAGSVQESREDAITVGPSR